MTPPTPPIRTGRAVASSIVVFLFGISTALLLLADTHTSVGEVGQTIDGETLAPWFLSATINSVGAASIVVSISTVLGVALALLVANRRSSGLPRWLEFACALPAFILTALWVTTTPGAPLVTLSVGVAVQRAFQVGSLISRAEQSRLASPTEPLSQVPDLELPQLARWRPFLWVAAAHSIVVLTAEHAALILLGLVAPLPNTWIATLCVAASARADIAIVAIGIAALGTITLPWALWVQGSGGAKESARH